MLANVHCSPTPFAPKYASPKLTLVTPQNEHASEQRSHNVSVSNILACESSMEPGPSAQTAARGNHEDAFDCTTRTCSVRHIHTIRAMQDSALLLRGAEEQSKLGTLITPYPEGLNDSGMLSGQGNLTQKDTVLVAVRKKTPSVTESSLPLGPSGSCCPARAPHYKSPRYVTSLSKLGQEHALEAKRTVPSNVSKKLHKTHISESATDTHQAIFNCELGSVWRSSNESLHQCLAATLPREMHYHLRRASRPSIQIDMPQSDSTEDAGIHSACQSIVTSSGDRVETNDEQHSAVGSSDFSGSQPAELPLQIPDYGARSLCNCTQPTESGLPTFSIHSQKGKQSMSRPNMKGTQKEDDAHYCAKLASALCVWKRQRRLHTCVCWNLLQSIRLGRQRKFTLAGSLSHAVGNRGHASSDSTLETLVMYSHLPQSGRAAARAWFPQNHDCESDRQEKHARRWLRITVIVHSINGACLIFISMGLYVAFPSAFMASKFTQQCVIFRLCSVAAVSFSAKSCKGMRLYASKVLRLLPR